MNPNQDNLVINRKPYVNYPELKHAASSIIAVCMLQLLVPNYAPGHQMTQLALLKINFSSTTDVRNKNEDHIAKQ